MKSRRKSRVARGRRRNARGHFVKASAAAPRRRKRRAAAPAAAPRRRKRRAARATSAAPRRRRRRAAAPAAAPRRRRRARVTAAAPRRRRRRAAARDWPGDRAGHKRAARKGVRRRKARKSAARLMRSGRTKRVRSLAARRLASRRRRARAREWTGDFAGHRRAARKGWRKRKAKRSSPKRRASSKRTRRAHSRRSPRRGYYRYSKKTRSSPIPDSHYGPGGAFEGYVLSNPLSGGELVLVGLTGLIGYGISDFVGRYMQTTAVAAGAAANSIPTGAVVPNDQITSAFPTWQSAAAQFGVAAVPGIAAAFVDSPWARAALQGLMLGAGFSLAGNVVKGLMAKLIGATPLGQQLYLAEVEAQATVAAATPATATSTAGTAGLPRGVGARPTLRDPGPRARGIGQTAAQMANTPGGFVPSTQPGGLYSPPGILTNSGNVLPTGAPGTPTPGGPTTGPMCAPCTSTSGGIAATHETAMQALRDESCLGAPPVGFGMYATFPAEEAA